MYVLYYVKVLSKFQKNQPLFIIKLGISTLIAKITHKTVGKKSNLNNFPYIIMLF